ncbi:hypothetical protein D9M69_471650 [compost metagenome]
MKLVGLPATKRGSSGCSGMKMVPLPPLVTRSRPWSKNCPKKVIQALKGAVSPASGAVLGMKFTCWSSAVPNSPSRPGLVTRVAPSVPAAAATAAGLLLVWSTIRLEIVRGSASTTSVEEL